jgi:hypothetical protein
MSILKKTHRGVFKRMVLSLLCLLCLGNPCFSASPTISKEYQVKAVFLFNCAQFVTWPAEAFSSPTQPFRIGILGKDPFGTFLDETVQGEKVDGRSLVVERYDRPEDAKDCQILFISSSENSNLKNILEVLKNSPVLTVGDVTGFTHNGGMINFFIRDNRIRFRINLYSAQQAQLSISSKMLRLADLVRTDKE